MHMPGDLQEYYSASLSAGFFNYKSFNDLLTSQGCVNDLMTFHLRLLSR